MESEADYIGMQLMAKACFDPHEMPRVSTDDANGSALSCKNILCFEDTSLDISVRPAMRTNFHEAYLKCQRKIEKLLSWRDLRSAYC